MSHPGHVTLLVPDGLVALMFRRSRASRARLALDGTSTIGHLIGSTGLPLCEIGAITADRRPVDQSWLPQPGAVVELAERPRPQPAPTSPPRFALDVHLGALARRMRFVGLDTTWRNDTEDDALVASASADRRVVLSRDHGVLLRREVRDAAYIRNDRPDDQLIEVVTRFAAPLRPWSRCPRCNAAIEPVPKADVAGALEPGTRRSYETFARCPSCHNVYWRGAHEARLQRLLDRLAEAGAL